MEQGTLESDLLVPPSSTGYMKVKGPVHHQQQHEGIIQGTRQKTQVMMPKLMPVQHTK